MIPEVVVILAGLPIGADGRFPQEENGVFFGMQSRMDAAVKTYLRFPKALYILVGESVEGKSVNKPDEMARYLHAKCPNILIKKINSLPCTWHNIIALFAQAGPALFRRRVWLLTNSYHMPRALAFWEEVKMKNYPNIPSPFPLTAESVVGNTAIMQYKLQYEKRIEMEKKGLRDFNSGLYKEHCKKNIKSEKPTSLTFVEENLKNIKSFLKTKAKLVSLHSLPFILLGVVILFASIFLVNNVFYTQSNKAYLVNRSPEEVTFSTLDGFMLSGTYWPGVEKGSPVVILIHAYNSTRKDFETFIPELLKDGYGVLAYDTRGFGKSKDVVGSVADFPKDIFGAIEYIHKKPSLAESKIGIVGLSVGANEAIVAIGSRKDVEAAVVVSPSALGNLGLLLGNQYIDFYLKNVFIVSSRQQKTDADFVYKLAHEPKVQKTYEGLGQGVNLLANLSLQQDIKSFLHGHLLP